MEGVPDAFSRNHRACPRPARHGVRRRGSACAPISPKRWSSPGARRSPRRVAVDLPEGTHSIVIPMRDLGDASLIEVTGPDGLSIGAPVPLDRIAIAEGSLDSAAEAEARAAVDAAEDAVQAARGRIGPPGRGDSAASRHNSPTSPRCRGAAQMARRCRRTLPTCRSFLATLGREIGAHRHRASDRAGRPAAPMRTPSRSGWTTCRRLRSRSDALRTLRHRNARASASTCRPAKRSMARWRSPYPHPGMRNGGQSYALRLDTEGRPARHRTVDHASRVRTCRLAQCGLAVSRRPFPTVVACPRASGPTPCGSPRPCRSHPCAAD